ncbi:ferritin family protein [bacterium]|nr:ferritin family protein [bacterium]
MSITFNFDEIFEMAEQIERNGARFYRRAAGKFSDSEAREKLLELAVMEDQHEKTFTGIRLELAGCGRMESTFDPENQAALYLQAMADGTVFDIKKDPSDILSEGKTLEEILHIAIGLEKDSIVFYAGIKDMVPEKPGKEKIDVIIREEKGHIVELSNQLALL